MRDVERQVMLRIIDQRWREHLEEMDYLQEGINLRAMGQKDPLTEWQREGFDMFGTMMKGVAQDFVRYVMHVQVVRNDAPVEVVQNLQQSSADRINRRVSPAPHKSAAASGEMDQDLAASRVDHRCRRETSACGERSNGRRRRAMRRAHVAPAKSSRCATAPRCSR